MKDAKPSPVETAQIYDFGRAPDAIPERARRLHVEAQILACEEVEQLRLVLRDAVDRAERIRDGGALFPVGLREQARQVAATLPQIMNTLQALTERHLREVTNEPMPPVWGRSPSPSGENASRTGPGETGATRGSSTSGGSAANPGHTAGRGHGPRRGTS